MLVETSANHIKSLIKAYSQETERQSQNMGRIVDIFAWGSRTRNTSKQQKMAASSQAIKSIAAD